ncbi:hypothetical protein SNE40_000645 [Patella caerulea]|uniref:Uncharacterized protein n=1 Tax=Patella caerulea TaxID=87958 RepID=A0AAN8KBQ2_PATCE
MESLKDKVVIITGASSGIGEGTAVMFAQYGSRVVLSGRSSENLERVAGRCREVGLTDHQILVLQGDLANDDVRKKLIDETIKKYGQLDVLVNNAGVCHLVDTTKTTPEYYDDMMNTNTRAPFFLTQYAIPYLKQSKGNIINVSSQFSEMAVPQMYGVYCMTKAAMDMFTKCLSLELGPFGIRVNSVNPGSVASNLEKRGPTALSEETYNYFLSLEKQRHPIGRVGTAEDIAWGIVFLACDRSSFISGERMFIDGASHWVTGSVQNPE